MGVPRKCGSAHSAASLKQKTKLLKSIIAQVQFHSVNKWLKNTFKQTCQGCRTSAVLTLYCLLPHQEPHSSQVFHIPKPAEGMCGGLWGGLCRRCPSQFDRFGVFLQRKVGKYCHVKKCPAHRLLPKRRPKGAPTKYQFKGVNIYATRLL